MAGELDTYGDDPNAGLVAGVTGTAGEAKLVLSFICGTEKSKRNQDKNQSSINDVLFAPDHCVNLFIRSTGSVGLGFQSAQ